MKQECGETLGDLEPVYHLFTITGEITLPQAVTHVIYARKRTARRKEPQNKEEKHSKEELGRRRRKTRLKMKHSEQMKETY